MSTVAVFDPPAAGQPVRRKRGRKMIWKHIMTIYFDVFFESVAIPYRVFEAMKEPPVINLRYVEREGRLLIRRIEREGEITGENTVVVPSRCYEEKIGLYFEMPDLTGSLRDVMDLGDETYAAQCCLVYNQAYEKRILCDLNIIYLCDSIPEQYAGPEETADEILKRKGWKVVTKKDFKSVKR